MISKQEAATFVGIDAHASRCSIKAVSSDGAELAAVDVCTRKRALRAALRTLPRPVWVMVEASTMAPFVRDCLATLVDRVIVCETRENRWVAKSEDKSDLADADRLARLLRLGEYKEVYLPGPARQELRELMILQHKAAQDVARAKNRIKSKYRQHGIAVTGTGVYSAAGRQGWLEQVTRPTVRFMLEVLYDSLDATVATQKRIVADLLRRLRPTSVYRRLVTIPGFGPVVCASFIVVVDDPWRFPTKRKLWKYAGLSVRTRSSGEMKRPQQGGSRSGNRLLKYAAMLAAYAAIRRRNRFARHYQEMVASGVEPAMAIRTAARNILAAAWAIWKNGSVYHDHR